MNTDTAFQKSYDFYKNLYINLRQIPKRDRFTWGERCELLALELLRSISRATYASRPSKQSLLNIASDAVDMLKIYLRLGIELHILSQRHGIDRQAELQELGKMLGGWIKNAG